MTFIDIEIIKLQRPIFRLVKISRHIVLEVIPIKAAIIFFLLFPMASNMEDRGDSIYSNKQIGARTFK